MPQLSAQVELWDRMAELDLKAHLKYLVSNLSGNVRAEVNAWHDDMKLQVFDKIKSKEIKYDSSVNQQLSRMLEERVETITQAILSSYAQAKLDATLAGSGVRRDLMQNLMARLRVLTTCARRSGSSHTDPIAEFDLELEEMATASSMLGLAKAEWALDVDQKQAQSDGKDEEIQALKSSIRGLKGQVMRLEKFNKELGQSQGEDVLVRTVERMQNKMQKEREEFDERLQHEKAKLELKLQQERSSNDKQVEILLNRPSARVHLLNKRKAKWVAAAHEAASAAAIDAAKDAFDFCNDVAEDAMNAEEMKTVLDLADVMKQQPQASVSDLEDSVAAVRRLSARLSLDGKEEEAHKVLCLIESAQIAVERKVEAMEKEAGILGHQVSGGAVVQAEDAAVSRPAQSQSEHPIVAAAKVATVVSEEILQLPKTVSEALISSGVNAESMTTFAKVMQQHGASVVELEGAFAAVGALSSHLMSRGKVYEAGKARQLVLSAQTAMKNLGAGAGLVPGFGPGLGPGLGPGFGPGPGGANLGAGFGPGLGAGLGPGLGAGFGP